MKYLKALVFNLWKLYIGIMFASTLLLFYPLFLVFLSREKLKPLTFRLNVFWSRIMRILCFYAVHVEGELPKNQPYIICANHTSYLDIFLMYSVIKDHKFLFMGKSEILSYPLVKTFFKKLNIPVFRNDRIKAAKSFIKARQEIKKGWSIVIFPEGGIPEKTPFMIPLKDGAFKLAKSVSLGILPLTFQNNYRLFSDPENILDCATPGLAKIVLHPFIPAEKIAALPLEELNKMVFDSISGPLPKKV